MTPQQAATQAQTGTLAEGTVIYNGAVYDRKLRRCSVYAVADGAGGVEWRVAKDALDFEGDGAGGVERCFKSYAEAMRWLV